MRRISRSVAQRHAAKKKRRKHPPRIPARPAPAPSAPASEPAATSSATAPASAAQPRPLRPQAARAAPRRTFAEYRDQYRYVLSDVRRIAIIAGGLVAALVALSFVIR